MDFSLFFANNVKIRVMVMACLQASVLYHCLFGNPFQAQGGSLSSCIPCDQTFGMLPCHHQVLAVETGFPGSDQGSTLSTGNICMRRRRLQERSREERPDPRVTLCWALGTKEIGQRGCHLLRVRTHQSWDLFCRKQIVPFWDHGGFPRIICSCKSWLGFHKYMESYFFQIQDDSVNHEESYLPRRAVFFFTLGLFIYAP